MKRTMLCHNAGLSIFVYFILFVVVGAFLSCKKEPLRETETSFSDRIILNKPEAQGRQIHLKWSILKSPNFAYYEIVRKKNELEPGSVIKRIGSNLLNAYTDSLLPYSPYLEYQVIGYLNNGDTITSNKGSCNFPDLMLALNTLQKSGDSIIINWKPVTNSDIKSYKVYRRQSENDGYYQIAHVGKEIRSVIDTGYYFGKNIGYLIEAEFPNDEKIYSNWQSINAEAKIVVSYQFNEDSAKLTWSPIRARSLRAYKILRKLSGTDEGKIIATITDFQKTNFVDANVPYNPLVMYQVIGDLWDDNYYSIASNAGFYLRNIVTVSKAPFNNIEYDSKLKYLFFFDYQTIHVVDIPNNKLIHSRGTGTAGVGFCSFGDYNGKRELYVPSWSGSLQIYNAATMEKITELNTGKNLLSAMFHKNKIFVSATDGTYVYDRASEKELVKLNAGGGRFRMIPRSDVSFLFTSTANENNTIGRIDFDALGNFVSVNYKYQLPQPPHSAYLEAFTSGDRFITSNNGYIYSSDLIYQTTLTKGNFLFSCFAFRPDNTELLAGTNKKTIEVYSSVDYSHIRTINTSLYPRRIFVEGSKLIIVGATEQPPLNESYIFSQVLNVEYKNL